MLVLGALTSPQPAEKRDDKGNTKKISHFCLKCYDVSIEIDKYLGYTIINALLQ